jgi:Raf kinase inhibitor-like YbhB/YbcL family protein
LESKSLQGIAMNLQTVVTRAYLSGARISIVLIVLIIAGCGRPDSLPPEDPDRLTIQLRSPAFADGAAIPQTFTCDGVDRSPPLEWSGVPDAARSLVFICDDPDAPRGTWSHWVVFNLPVQIKALKEGVPADQTVPATALEGSPPQGTTVKAIQGKNDFGNTGYGGPCPPGGTHRYFFRLYAVDAKLDLNGSATRADVLKAIEGRILAEGRLMGKYKRVSIK